MSCAESRSAQGGSLLNLRINPKPVNMARARLSARLAPLIERSDMLKLPGVDVCAPVAGAYVLLCCEEMRDDVLHYLPILIFFMEK